MCCKILLTELTAWPFVQLCVHRSRLELYSTHCRRPRLVVAFIML